MQKKVNDPNTTPIKQDVVKYKIRASIDNFYDTQKLRIQCGNRICAAIRQTDDETENDNILKTLASEYNRVTDVLAEKYKSSRRSLGKAIKATDDLEIIKSEIDYNMAEQYVALLNQEQQISKFISSWLRNTQCGIDSSRVWMGAALSWQLCASLIWISTRLDMLVLSGVMLV